MSGESGSELDEGAKSKTIVPSSSSTKGVKWNPALVEFSDGSKSPATRVVKKSDPTNGGKGRGSGKKGDTRGQKKPTKPPMVSTLEYRNIV